MEWLPLWIVIAIVIFIILRKAGVFDDKYERQARLDQKQANYPGCARGAMRCYDFCDCNGTTYPRERWVKARADDLRRRATCRHEHVVPKYSKMFPEIGPRGEQCLGCGMIRDAADQPWKESDD